MAGASGLLAAGMAANLGSEVLLLEKNNIIGKKILITGKGRCNVTNNCDNTTFLKNVRTNPKFLYSAINHFNTQHTIDFFEKLDVKLKIERGNRVFPFSDTSLDIVNALKKFISIPNLTLRLNCNVKNVLVNGNNTNYVELKNGTKIFCKKVILATGGKSYPGTGSTGDGFTFAKNLGHSITKLQPSLVPIDTKIHGATIYKDFH